MVTIGLHSVNNILNVLASGNVGIGTTSPSERLHVNGTGRVVNIHLKSTYINLNRNGSNSAIYDSTKTALEIEATTDLSILRTYNVTTQASIVLHKNGCIGIGTKSPSYKLHVAGDAYTSGWSRANNGFYVEGTGVHFTHQGNHGEIDISSSNELLWASSDANLYFNYRAASRGRTVTNYIWNAGSSSSYASHTLGALISRGDQALYGLTQTCNKANNANYMNSALQIREYNFGGAQSDTWAIAPRLSWHWSGRVQTQIGLNSSGDLKLSKDNFATSYLLLHLGNSSVSGGGSSVGSSITVNIGGTSKTLTIPSTSTYTNYLKIHDVRGTNHLPNSSTYPEKYITAWFNSTGTPDGSWWSGITVKGWTNGYSAWQLCSYSSTGTANNYGLYVRNGVSNGWGSWRVLLDSGNSSIGDYNVKINGTTKQFVRDWGHGAANMNAVARGGRSSMGMANLTTPSGGTASYVNPNGQTDWHHFINIAYTDGGAGSNSWVTQIANKAGTTDLWVRSRSGGTISDTASWAAGWTRILTGSNYTNVLDGRYLRYNGWWNSGSGQNVNNALGMVFAYSDHGAPGGWGITTTFECVMDSSYRFQMHADGYNNRVYFRNKSADRGGWLGWKQIATTDMVPNPANYYWANIRVSASSSTGTQPTFNTCYTSNWFRSTGATGWYSESYGGGIHMQDSTWVRTYNGKSFYCSAVIQAGNRIYTGYDSGQTNSISCSNWFRSNGNTGWYNESYGGGWYMSDTSWVRTFNNKGVVASCYYASNWGSATYLLRSDGGAAAFNWSGQGGQPTWLWGGNSQHTYYVYNPSNFNVNSAAKLRVVSCYNGTTNNDLWSTIKSSNSSYLGTSTMYEVYNDGGPTTYGHILDTVTVHSNHWQSQLWMAAGKGGRLYYRNKDYNNDTWGDWRTVAWTTDTAPSVTVSNSDSNSTYRMVWHSGNNLYSTAGIYCNPSTDYLYASSMNASNWFRSSGNTGWHNPTNNCHVYPNATTTYGGLMFRGEKGGYTGFVLGTSNSYMNLMDNGTDKGLYQESNGQWILYYNRGSNYVGIRTSSLSYPLTINGDSYTNGWSRAANGFYVEGTGVHFTHQGSIGEIDMSSNNEFLWGSSNGTLFFNYRAASRGSTVSHYIWNAGSSSSYANHTVGKVLAQSTPSSWLDGQRYERGGFNLMNATDTGSYWPWFRQTLTAASKWISVGTLGNSLYFIGSATSRTANSYDYGFRMDFSNGYLYGNFSGYLSGTASYASNADAVDGQHFNWNNNKNDHTYLWAASSSGQAYLVHRASMSVNYATYARYVYCTSGSYLNFQWSGQGGQPTWLFGSNDGANVYVWNPSNFNVNSAAVLRGNASNPNNSHPGHGAKVFYSWDTGQANNASSGYSNGITIGSHPNDTGYGFQIVQNMWDDRTYTRRYNGGWQSWKTLAWTSDIPSVGNGTIIINQGGSEKGRFTVNQSGTTTINLTDSNTNTWRGVENVLTSTSTSNSLTANMGRVLANGASDRPIVLLAGTLYRSGASSSYTTWYFTGYRHRSISSSNPTVYISGGVARFYFTNASGYGFSFAQVCANHQASGEATGYQSGEYQTRSSGLFWFGTYASGQYLYIRAIAQGNGHNDTAESYTGMWTNYSDGVTRVSIIAVGHAW